MSYPVVTTVKANQIYTIVDESNVFLKFRKCSVLDYYPIQNNIGARRPLIVNHILKGGG